MEVKKSKSAKAFGKITKLFKKSNNINIDVDQSDLSEKSHIKEMESTISRQYREIKQQQMEIQQQQIEIKRLKKEMASRDEAAKRCIQQRSNEIRDIKAEKIKLDHDLELQKNIAVNLSKEADKLDVKYKQAQKRINSLVKKLKQPSVRETEQQSVARTQQSVRETEQQSVARTQQSVRETEQQSVARTQQSVRDTEPSTRATSPNLHQQRPSIGESTPKVVGSRCVASIKIKDITAAALLDTGSQVSVVSQSFYRQHFYKEMKPLTDIDVECANGNNLAYLGYITAAVDLPGAATDRPLLCSMLVAPDNTYNLNVPILLGTNVLQTAMAGVRRQFGNQFLKDANIHPPWHLPYTYMLLGEKECL